MSASEAALDVSFPRPHPKPCLTNPAKRNIILSMRESNARRPTSNRNPGLLGWNSQRYEREREKMRLLSCSSQNSSGSHRVEMAAYAPELPFEIVDAWRRSARQVGGVRSVCQGPEWTQYRVLRRFIPEPMFKLAILYNGTKINSVTPVVDDTFLLQGRRGVRTLSGLRNSGSEFLLPSSAEVYGAFVKNLFHATNIDYLRFVGPRDDPLLAFLLNKPRCHDWTVFVPPQKQFYYRWIELSVGQQVYWRRFSSKQRYNLNRELKILSSLGEIEVIRVSSLEDIALFAEIATQIGRLSWQYRSTNSIAREIDASELHRLLEIMSQHKMLRSYLLKVGDEYPCFWTAFQGDRSFWLYDTGFNPLYTKFSPGKCLLQLIINDLFAYDLPLYCSFGLMADPYHYKSVFSTNSSQETDVLVLRNSLQNQIDTFAHKLIPLKNS